MKDTSVEIVIQMNDKIEIEFRMGRLGQDLLRGGAGVGDEGFDLFGVLDAGRGFYAGDYVYAPGVEGGDGFGGVGWG